MSTYTFTYKAGCSIKRMNIRAVSLTEARVKFDSARPARSNLMQVSEA